MPAQLGFEFRTLLTGLGLVQIALACAIVGLAFLGYRRNQSRPMLYLSLGIGTLVIAPTLFRVVFQPKIGIQESALVAMGLESLGLAIIFYSIVLARGN